MEHFHTIIIGAGPAGLSCAKHLAQKGVKVLVLEKKATIGPKVCAGGIPFHAQQELHLPERLIQGSFPSQIVQTPWQRATVASSEPIIVTVDRYALGQWMLEEALRAGAAVRNNVAVLSIAGTTVRTKNQSYGFDTLVGADGSSSMVRQYLNLPVEKIGVGINYQIRASVNDMEWHLDPGRFRSGYAWIFPHKDTTSVGAYAERFNLPPQRLHTLLLDWAAANSINLHGAKSTAALINFDYRGWKFNNIFLAGDAAGLASGFTGEGIYPAIISGQTIAETIINPEYTPKRLTAILCQHRRHQQVQKFFCGRKVICQITMEMLVLALRFKLLQFNLLEMY
jgi:geranylgeranyl reductase